MPVSHATKPGFPVSPLAQGEEPFELFVASFYYKNHDVDPAGLTLLWVPEFLRSSCLGKTLKQCRKLDHCLDFPNNEGCANFDIRHVKRRTHSKSSYEEHFKLRTFEITLYDTNPSPDAQNIVQIGKVLGHKDLKTTANKLGVKVDSHKSGDVEIPLTKSATIKAHVRWIVFPNGTSANLISVSAP